MRKEMKEKIVKSLVIIFSIILGGAVGFFIAYNKDNNVIPKEYTGNPILLNIFLFLLVFFISIALHELAHFFTFIKNGIKMRGLIILGLTFIKKNGKWKFSFRWQLLNMLGGIAIPSLHKIDNDKEYEKVRIAMANSIIAAPIVNILIGVASLLIGIPLMKYSPTYLKPTMAILVVFFIIISILTTISCLVKNDIVIGDFPAYKLFKNDEFFSIVQIYQYITLAENGRELRKDNIFLREKLIFQLEKMYDKKDTSMFVISSLDMLIQEYLIGVINEIPEVVIKYSNYFIKNKDSLNKDEKHEWKNIFLIHLLYLLNELEKKEEAKNLYRMLLERLPNNEVYNYYRKQIKHVLKIEDNSEFLKEKKNIKANTLYFLWSLLDLYYEDELKLSKIN